MQNQAASRRMHLQHEWKSIRHPWRRQLLAGKLARLSQSSSCHLPRSAHPESISKVMFPSAERIRRIRRRPFDSRFPFPPARALGSRFPRPAGSNLKPEVSRHHIHEGEKIRSRLKGSDGDHIKSVQVRNRVSLDAMPSHAGTPLRTGRCIIKCLT